MRCFLAVYPGEEARGVLADVVPDDGDEVRVTDMADWHVTLRFLGELDDERVAAVRDAVGSVLPSVPHVRVSLGPATALGTGARVLFAPAKGLDSVVDVLDGVLDHEVDPRDGPFRGHLTLARARGRGRIPGSMAGRPVHTSFDADEVLLVGSRLDPDHAVHYVIQRFPLAIAKST